jgi:hypothetical protein
MSPEQEISLPGNCNTNLGRVSSCSTWSLCMATVSVEELCSRQTGFFFKYGKEFLADLACTLARLSLEYYHVRVISVITCMQGTYNYIPETNHFSRVYSVAAVLYLQFVLHVMLFNMWNMFCTFTLLLPRVCVRCPTWMLFLLLPWFCAFLVWCPGIVCMGFSVVPRNCLYGFYMVARLALITLTLTFQMRWISILRYLYFRILY